MGIGFSLSLPVPLSLSLSLPSSLFLPSSLICNTGETYGQHICLTLQ